MLGRQADADPAHRVASARVKQPLQIENESP